MITVKFMTSGRLVELSRIALFYTDFNMSKKILNLVLSCETPPYDKMVQTALETWDSIEVEGIETVYYFGEPQKQNTDKFIYLPVEEILHAMGRKTLMAFEWALKNKEFDFLARPHSSIYVNKRELKEYVESLPNENVFAGVQIDATPIWCWGGTGFLFSRDVVQKLVGNKSLFKEGLMEDMGISYIANELGIPFMPGRGCSIDKQKTGWLCLCYGTESFTFDDFSEVTKSKGQYFFRCKNDGDRNVDEIVMRELFKYLQ